MNVYENFMVWLKDVGFAGILDMTILTAVIYSVIVWFKKTRAASVLTGIFIIAGAYLLARQSNLVMTAMIFEKFFAVFLVALVVIFQEELRSFFERVSRWGMRRRGLPWRGRAVTERSEIGVLIRAAAEFSRVKTGALIAIKGKDELLRHIDGGISLGGKISAPLLMSIFDDSSAGHDGALIVDNGIVTEFACHLPLSRNIAETEGHGTRHSAAVGLTERCDAICIVVSEEKGTISIAKNGRLRTIAKAEELGNLLEQFFSETQPTQKSKPWEDLLKRNSREKIIALVLAASLWFVNVRGSEIIYKKFTVPVTHVQLPKEWVLEECNPKTVDVTFHSKRSAFYFFRAEDIRLLAKYERVEGIRRIRLYSENLTYPESLIFDHFDPIYIDVRLKKVELPPKNEPKAPPKGPEVK